MSISLIAVVASLSSLVSAGEVSPAFEARREKAVFQDGSDSEESAEKVHTCEFDGNLRGTEDNRNSQDKS